MVTARTVAMSMNRLIDAELDSLNPRTQSRALPSGSLSGMFYMGIVLLCSSAFIISTALFGMYKNIWPVILSLQVLLFISASLICPGLVTPHRQSLYSVAVCTAVLLLIYQHAIVNSHALSRVNLAFFTLNRIISVLLGTLGIVDVFVR